MPSSPLFATTAVFLAIAAAWNARASVAAQAATAPSADASSPADAIDEVVAATMAEDGLPSVAIVVGHAGTIVKQAAYGMASIDPPVPATLRTVYPIASATKTFTSTAIFLLAREGKFSLDDSIIELLPDLPDAWLEVTPRHLLTHTSGLPDVAITPGREPLIATTRAEALVKLRTMPLAFPVATRWAYNQTNYMLLLMLVEKFGQRSFPAFVRERLFAPLRLELTTFGDADDVVPGRASMYERRGGALVPRHSRFPEFVRGAAGINTSAEEWYRWADAWAHARVLPQADLDLLWAPAQLASGATVSLGANGSYGSGVMVTTGAGQRSVGHSGGGNAAFRYFVDEDLLVVMLTNGMTNEDAFVGRIAAAAREKRAK